jgi:transposase
MARVKKKDYEKLDDTTVSLVISLLEDKKPITKKEACEILNINYNTQRLNRIIQEYKDKIEFTKRQLKANKGKPFDDYDLREIAISYLSGESVTNIAANLYRSIHVVKNQIKKLHLPERSKKHSYHTPNLIPEEAVSEGFEIGELVWSARYNTVVEIDKEWKVVDGSNYYRIWLYGKNQEFAIQPAEELGKLEVLKQLNIDKKEFQTTDKPNFEYRID